MVKGELMFRVMGTILIFKMRPVIDETCVSVLVWWGCWPTVYMEKKKTQNKKNSSHTSSLTCNGHFQCFKPEIGRYDVEVSIKSPTIQEGEYQEWREG